MMTRAGWQLRGRRWIAAGAAGWCLAAAGQGQWTQWGGAGRDFQVTAGGLAERWPEGGPRQVWKRKLGDGYATILCDGGVLYTMYRAAEDEFTVALRAENGATLWEHRNRAPFTDTMREFGPGPHATPLVVGERLYSVGTNGLLHCYEKASGKVLWKHDLVWEYEGELRARGYSCSPLAYRNLVILPVGSETGGPGAVALDQVSGEEVWRAATFRATYASPLLIRFDGEDQLVLFMASELVGVNPANGATLWTVAHRNSTSVNAATPLWDGRDTLYCSNAYDGGTRAVRLTRAAGGTTVPRELWYTTEFRLQHGNGLLSGDLLFGSSGMQTALLTGVNPSTGAVLFRQRGFSKATCLAADGKIILLDEDGQLALAKLTPAGFEVLSRCEVAEPFAWAAPTLVGTRLYLRDREHILALELGQG